MHQFVCCLHGEGKYRREAFAEIVLSRRVYIAGRGVWCDTVSQCPKMGMLPGGAGTPLSRARSSLRCRDCASACCAAAVDAVGKAPSSPYPPRPSCTVNTSVKHCRCQPPRRSP